MMPGRKPLLEIVGLRTQFFLHEGVVTALDGIDFTVYEKESVGIVGETGCGKSMTAFSILRLVPGPGKITAGNIFFMEPQDVRQRRMQLEIEAQEWYRRSSLVEKKKLVALYDYRDTGRKKKAKKLTPAQIDKIVPPDRVPTGVTRYYLAQNAKTMPASDKVGRAAALFSFDLLTRTDDQMRSIRGKSISMIFQDPATALDPVFTVAYQLGEVISLHQGIYDRAVLDKKIEEVLKLVRIAAPVNVMKQYPHELSGGMKQRVMIALALSCSPSLLIADEPTTALDVTIQAQILNLLRDLMRTTGSSMMLITHNLGVVAEVCDRICVMYAGRIVEEAETFELFANPRHPYTAGLLAAFPKLGERKDELSVIRGTVPNLMRPFQGCAFVERCEKATEVCGEDMPRRVEISPGHFVSCHLWTGKEGPNVR
ncbi:MAG: hypothetical protein A3K60_05710 [Euryarchaeota archaeon RBG_19FT_COMBO_56_21]|nr:MAG: hypothetical protein A3K60_05710 [Euryarchaeota archaeon RBG_19FT_COMBO_56_21]